MTVRLLLDELLPDGITRQLRERGHDVVSVVADHNLVGASDAQVLACAATAGRAVVTALDKLLSDPGIDLTGQVRFLER